MISNYFKQHPIIINPERKSHLPRTHWKETTMTQMTPFWRPAQALRLVFLIILVRLLIWGCGLNLLDFLEFGVKTLHCHREISLIAFWALSSFIPTGTNWNPFDGHRFSLKNGSTPARVNSKNPFLQSTQLLRSWPQAQTGTRLVLPGCAASLAFAPLLPEHWQRPGQIQGLKCGFWTETID